MALSTDDVSLIIGAVGIAGSWIGAAFISGRKSGAMDVRVAVLENSQDKLATKEQLAGIKEDLAEVKGMLNSTFRLVPRDP